MTTQAQSTGTRLTRKLALASGAVVMAAAGTNDVQAGIIAAIDTPIGPPVEFRSIQGWDLDGAWGPEFHFEHSGRTTTYNTPTYGSTVIVRHDSGVIHEGGAAFGGLGRLLRAPTNPSKLEKLANGAMIGAGGLFAGDSQWNISNFLTIDGVIRPFADQWSKGETGFFGFFFNRDGQRHYGWGELKFDPTSVNSNGYGFQVTRAYYNDTPGASIAAGDTGGGSAVPEPSTLALAMLAAGGVAAYRSRRKQPAA